MGHEQSAKLMKQNFDWTVRQNDWPPRQLVQPPYSLTRVDIALSCPLRVVFEVANNYERMVSFDARIGTAMHETLEHFADHPLSFDDPSLVPTVKKHFEESLNQQRQKAAVRPREKNLEENQQRIDKTFLAVLRQVKSGEIFARKRRTTDQKTQYLTEEDGRTTWLEKSVESKDHKFVGKVDKAVKDATGLTIFDYKSSMHNDLPERYSRQVQMYVEMWTATTGERPTKGVVVYPLLDKAFAIDVSPQATKKTLETCQNAIKTFGLNKSAEDLAKPGQVCSICEFKPWCEPFWNWVSSGTLPGVQKQSRYGFQGEIKEVGRVQDFLKIKLAWHVRSIGVLLIPWGKLAHAQQLVPGQTIRVTGCELKGQVTSPLAQWATDAELFRVEK